MPQQIPSSHSVSVTNTLQGVRDHDNRATKTKTCIYYFFTRIISLASFIMHSRAPCPRCKLLLHQLALAYGVSASLGQWTRMSLTRLLEKSVWSSTSKS
mmetsp:Transcript_21667/g.70128  ORF Transcript_21667/g.70128 Transcript_21667/m.70128 type:complete len:99 (-) Transcript_21667:103-399(-)